MRKVLLASLGFVAALCLCSGFAGAWDYPPTQKNPVVEDYHGVEISDPYQWLEDGEADAVIKWTEEQEAFTHSIIDKCPQKEWIVQRLDEAGMTYKVVGGAAAALHGVPLAVKDLDLETDADGPYQFQTLFPNQALEPVTLRESQVYRSHFGRFDFDGLTVDVMGDLHRRDAESWIPTAAATETMVDLEGTSVPVSWLEEETLAYIRRGRLERAAQCLPLCDTDRLLTLLRGEKALGVL